MRLPVCATLGYAAFVVALAAARGHGADADRVVAQSASVLVVSVGDSIAYGFGVPSRATKAYAALYARSVGARLLNLAVPGVTCADVASVQIPEVPRSASTVIVNCGTNDIGGFGFMPSGLPDGAKRATAATDAQLGAAKRRFVQMIDLLRRKAPRARIALLNLRHWQRMTGAEAPRFARDVQAWNAMLKATGLRVIDISADHRLYRKTYIQRDLLHPNGAGHEAMATDVRSALAGN